MIYVFLDVVITGLFIFFTNLIDRRFKSDDHNLNFFSISLLLGTIESALFLLVVLLTIFGHTGFTNQFMKFVYVLDGAFFVTISMGLLNLGTAKRDRPIKILRVLLYTLVLVFIFVEYKFVSISLDDGIKIITDNVFSGDAQKFFPWTWGGLYTAVIKVGLPLVCFVTLMLLMEDNGSQVERYQDMLLGYGILLYWLAALGIRLISTAVPQFSMLFMIPNLILIFIFYTSFQKTSVPSGKGFAVTILRFVLAYLIPAVAIGVFCFYFQPEESNYNGPFIGFLVAVSVLLILVALWLSYVLSTTTKLYAADYEAALEKDLATIDYNEAEMDVITNRMYEIFRKNVESSSLNVYIADNKGILQTAYSSNNLDLKFPVNAEMFDSLLNINKSVISYSEIEKRHELLPVKDDLDAFFTETKSDCLIILNEGHNIFGLMTLGKKAGNDHYKEYDVDVFVRLYSYFFVFGYFMRNIANKDVLGTVNREIRMSAQIIKSIQENIDRIKNPKIDTGYLLVPAHNIGGEFIDFIRLSNTRHLFVVGDLSGKGIAASMNMVILKSIIRTFLAETHDFKELVVKVNYYIKDSLRKGTIFAGLFALVDFETDTLYYINCGISALMMYTLVYNNVIEIQGSGHVLGFVDDISPYISVKSTKLNHGDIILASTNGLISSKSLRGEMFGKERIQQCMIENSTYPSQRMAQFTYDNLVRFMATEQEEDVSILILKYFGDSSSEPEEKNSSKEPAEAVPQSEMPAEEASEAVMADENALQTEEQEMGLDIPDDSDDIHKLIAMAQAEAEDGEKADGEKPAETMVDEGLPEMNGEDAVQADSETALSEGEALDDGKTAVTAEAEGGISAADFNTEDFEMPDLSELDEIIKNANL